MDITVYHIVSIFLSVYLLIFLLTENYPVIETYVKYRNEGSTVRYTILILKKVAYDREHLLFDEYDVRMIKLLAIGNRVFNMNIKIL